MTARVLAIVALSVLAPPPALWAQAPPATATPPPLTLKSLGQPWRLKPYVSGSLTWTREVSRRGR